MLKIKLKILFPLFAIILLIGNTATAQTVDDYKANLFYKIFEKLIFSGDANKMNYVIATHGCSDDFVKKLKAAKPNQFFSGLKFDYVPYDPSTIYDYDIVIVDEKKNSELDKIYSDLLGASTNQNASIALFTNNWNKKEKVTINFVNSESSDFVSFEYYLENLSKFNINVDIALKELNGIDLNAKKLLEEAKNDLQKVQTDLVQKEKDLENTIKELDEQQEKIDEQKIQINSQQREIENKQLEIKKQQSNLQNVIAEMHVAQQKLIRQQESFANKEIELVEKQQAILDYQNRIDEMQSRFEEQSKIIDEKIAEVDEVNKQIEEKKKELGVLSDIIKLQRLALILFGFLLGVIIILAVWIFRNYRKMKHQNYVLEHQKSEIETQAEELEKANLELEKLSIVASKTNNAVSILDKKGNFDWINAGFTKLYGYTLQLLRNEIDSNIENIHLYKGISSTFKKVIVEKKSLTFEHESTARNKQLMWIHSNITPILDYDNEVKQVIIIDTDISEIKEAEQHIALQNKSIKNSILYASRIQKATLPSTRILLSYLPDSFVLYLPRDIVSGDFYWSYKIGSKIFFTAADCTGHGVPGAFMSMLGITLLNEIVTKLEFDALRPDIVLNNLREKLIMSLRQKEDDKKTSDGIDLAFCMVETGINKLHFAGAHNELIHIRDGVLTDYHADEMPIGVSSKNNYEPFTNNVIDYQKGDVIYLFSDGYVDQFGGKGTRKKKFMISRLRELFLEINQKSADEQKDILLKEHLEWKGKTKQIDDVLIMGVRL
ncbi:MAG: SpoIIE family protein phosphatase [Bacteroidales bacterium]|nr:SpoIIE family protein phosphatase [Bacteroidales bacterium]